MTAGCIVAASLITRSLLRRRSAVQPSYLHRTRGTYSVPRIMALDVGEKTIGVAFTDDAGTMAFPGRTILRQEGFRRDMAVVRTLVAERDVQRIVIGLPLLEDGSHGDQATKVEAFIDRLRTNVRIPIDRQDEGYTTAGAAVILDELGRRRDTHKRTIDSVAACLILQDYLDRVNVGRVSVNTVSTGCRIPGHRTPGERD